VYKAIFTTELR